MRLDRNTTKWSGRGKYALIKLRKLEAFSNQSVLAMADPSLRAAIDFGDSDDTDFFVIRLKDKHAAAALGAYAMSAFRDDEQFGLEMLNLAKKAAEYQSPQAPT